MHIISISGPSLRHAALGFGMEVLVKTWVLLKYNTPWFYLYMYSSESKAYFFIVNHRVKKCNRTVRIHGTAVLSLLRRISAYRQHYHVYRKLFFSCMHALKWNTCWGAFAWYTHWVLIPYKEESGSTGAVRFENKNFSTNVHYFINFKM